MKRYQNWEDKTKRNHENEVNSFPKNEINKKLKDNKG